MADKSVAPATPSFPRRDEHGRVARLPELIVAGLGGVLVTLAPLALIDGVIALLGTGKFGGASGWLTLVLPSLIFFDDLRAWRGYWARFLVAMVGAVAGIGLGLVVSGLASGAPPILSGTAGAAVAVLVYCLVWHPGIRWATRMIGGGGRRKR